MSYRRRRRRDLRRGKSIEDILISKEELSIILDENDIGMGGIREDSEVNDEELSASNSAYGLHIVMDTPTSEDYVGQLLDEIDHDLHGQYPTPPSALTPQQSTGPDTLMTPVSMRRQRSDSHWRSQTPLAVKKYTNCELDLVVLSKKPRLLCAHESLPQLADMKDETERRDVLKQKLSLCEVLCDFRIVHGASTEESISDERIVNEMQCIENKKNMLREVTAYIKESKSCSIYILEQLFRTIQTNLFRSLPDSFIQKEFRGVDAPVKYTLPLWQHLQFIYELLFQVIISTAIDKEKLSTYFSGSFLNNFVQLFHSLCTAEVDYVKILIHSMYLDFVALRDEIRISLSQYCWNFIYCGNGTPDGINAILDIMNSILQGLDDEKLNDPAKWYMVLCHVLCPLHKGANYKKFEHSLYRCIKTFIKSQPCHFVVVFNHGILKFWPKTNPSKESLFMKAILNILKMVKRSKFLCDAQFTPVFECMIFQLRFNLLSPHYQIVHETIESFKDKLMRQCIEFHGGEEGWQSIYRALIYVTHHHFLYLTRNDSKQMLDWLKKYRITKKHVQLFEKLESQYTEETAATQYSNEESDETHQQRENQWRALSALAAKNKTKLRKMRKQKSLIQFTPTAILTFTPTTREQAANETALAKTYSFDEETNRFIYPTSFASSPITRAASYQQEAQQSSPRNTHYKSKSHHVLHHSGPMTSFREFKTMKPTPIHTKRSSEVENDYGYPAVHKAYKSYVDNKKIDCRSPSHLVLFSKKEGLKGVTFSSTNKYFKTRKVAVAKKKADKANKKQKKKETTRFEVKRRVKPKQEEKQRRTKRRDTASSASRRKRVNSKVCPSPNVIANGSANTTAINVNRFKRRKSRERINSITSPLIAAVRKEKEEKIDEDDELSLSPSIEGSVSPVALPPLDHKEKKKEVVQFRSMMNQTNNTTNGKTVFRSMNQLQYTIQPKDKKTQHLLDNTQLKQGLRSPATPGQIKANVETASTTYWSLLGKQTKNNPNLPSLVANEISLK